MEKLSEKDLWCQDLDAFVAEWELQLKEEDDYQKSIRNTNRRASRKIGAGKNSKGRAKADDEYAPKQTKINSYAPKPVKANPAKGVVKVEPKSSANRMKDMFQTKAKTKGFGLDGTDEEEAEASGLSDDDFDALRATKPAPKETSRAPSEQPGPTNGRTKRAAAAAPKAWVLSDDDESDGDDFLGDVGAMVKGIGNSDNDEKPAASSRVSLFPMATRPGSSHGNDIPKLKSKPSRTFDSGEEDETNYDLLARSSPQRAPPKDNLDSILSSDDEQLVPVTKKVPTKTAAPKAAAKLVAKPAAKPVAKPKKAPAAKKVVEEAKAPVKLSPAAKAYASKQKKMNLQKDVFSDIDDEDVSMDDADADSSPPKPAARGRPARAAAVAKKPITVDSDDEMDIDDNDESALVPEESEDDFDESE